MKKEGYFFHRVSENWYLTSMSYNFVAWNITENFSGAILFIRFFLSVYFSDFLLSTLLHLSLYHAPKFPFFQLSKIVPKSFSSVNLCHRFSTIITQKIHEGLSLVVLAQNGAFWKTIFPSCSLHVTFIKTCLSSLLLL